MNNIKNFLKKLKKDKEKIKNGWTIIYNKTRYRNKRI